MFYSIILIGVVISQASAAGRKDIGQFKRDQEEKQRKKVRRGGRGRGDGKGAELEEFNSLVDVGQRVIWLRIKRVIER